MIKVSTKNFAILPQYPFYDNWKVQNKSNHLIKYILPTEDLEDLNSITQNRDIIEEYL